MADLIIFCQRFQLFNSFQLQIMVVAEMDSSKTLFSLSFSLSLFAGCGCRASFEHFDCVAEMCGVSFTTFGLNGGHFQPTPVKRRVRERVRGRESGGWPLNHRIAFSLSPLHVLPSCNCPCVHLFSPRFEIYPPLCAALFKKAGFKACYLYL